MGRLIRRYIRCYDLTVRNSVELGTWASPITQSVADQIAVGAVINAIALGGTVVGAYFGVLGSVDLTGDLRGARIRTTINDAIDLTGTMYGLHIEGEVLGTGTISGSWAGIQIELYSPGTTTISGAVYGIHMANYLDKNPVGSYYLARLAETGTAAVVTAAIRFDANAGCDLLFQCIGSKTAWMTTGVCSSQAGKLKIQVDNLTRYIALYTAST